MTNALDPVTLAALEQSATEAAQAAGAYIASRFGTPLQVSDKSKGAMSDLVTDVDRASQKLVASLTVDKFPGHMLLGEEDAPENELPAAEFVWAVDPVDGTTNFVNGLPIHAVSIGVLHRGVPVAGAVWVPWPHSGAAGQVFHARAGGGAWFGSRRLAIVDPANGAPVNGRLSSVPGGLRWAYRVGKPLKRGIGEPRVGGSTAYETAMVAAGVFQFSVSGGGSRVWDYAATSLLVKEAGGAVYWLNPEGCFIPFSGWSQDYSNNLQTSLRLRRWSGPMLMAAPIVAAFVAANVKLRRPSVLSRIRRKLARN